MSNPYEAPAAAGAPPPPSGGGTFELSTALQDALDATGRNWLMFLVVGLVAIIAVVISFMLCLIPALAVVPVVQWGFVAFVLKGLDGEASFDDFSAAFSKFGEVLVPMFALLLLLFLIALPGAIASQIIQLIPTMLDTTDMLVLIGASGIGTLLSLAWSVVVVIRFAPASYLLVERGLGPVDAITEAWNLTEGHWGSLIVFAVVVQVLLPLLGILLCGVGIIPASMISAFATASMYRQLAGRP